MLELMGAGRALASDVVADAEHATRVAADERAIAIEYADLRGAYDEGRLAELVAFCLEGHTDGDVAGWLRHARIVSSDGWLPITRETLLDLYHLRAIPNALFRERFLAREVPHRALALIDYAHEPDDIGVVLRSRRMPKTSLFEAEYGGRGALEGKTSAQEVAELMGLSSASHLKRLLGIEPRSPYAGGRYVQLFITYRQAVRFCDALGIAYTEAGV